MTPETEEWLRQTLGVAHPYFAGEAEREKAAEERHRAVIRAIEDASRRQTEALERALREGLRELANALRDSRR